jgi:MFS family permease
MIEEAGGDGIFQTRVLLLVLLSLVFASLLLYALPFLLLFPQYTCFDHEGVQLAADDCTPSRVANDPSIRAEANQGADTTFANWVQDFNLVTENPLAAPTFFLLLFGGLALGGLVMAPIADRWSKKYLLVFGLSTILLVYILVCAASGTAQYRLLLGYVFIYGFALSIVIIAGLLLILQVLPRSSWALVVLYFLAASACVSFYVTAYFRYFTKTWRPLIESACLFLLLFIIFLCFSAESLGHLFE